MQTGRVGLFLEDVHTPGLQQYPAPVLRRGLGAGVPLLEVYHRVAAHRQDYYFRLVGWPVAVGHDSDVWGVVIDQDVVVLGYLLAQQGYQEVEIAWKWVLG